MHGEQDAPVETKRSGGSPEPYEPPALEVLGTVEELTRGPVNVGGDLNGHVISF